MQRTYLKATNPDGSDGSCTPAVSNDGSIVIGAYNEAGGLGGIDVQDTDNSAPGAGAVYIYD